MEINIKELQVKVSDDLKTNDFEEIIKRLDKIEVRLRSDFLFAAGLSAALFSLGLFIGAGIDIIKNNTVGIWALFIAGFAAMIASYFVRPYRSKK